MRFTTRNSYYLRLSAGAVIPLYLYLDEQHVSWMSERVLQHVLADLRPLIMTKLIMEENAHLGPGGSANAKKGTIDVHRGGKYYDTYQFGYFLRNTEPHAVLVKTRRFTAAPKITRPANPPPAQNVPVSTGAKAGRKRQRKANVVPKAKKASKGKGKAKQMHTDIEDEAEFSEHDPEEGDASVTEATTVRRSARHGRVAAGGYAENEDDEIGTESTSKDGENATAIPTENEEDGSNFDAGPDIPIADEPESPIPPEEDTLMVEEEEEKPKPVLQLRYQSFSVHGRCLCVIVEPYPPVRQQRQMSLAPTGVVAPRAPSIAPADFVPSGAAQRAKTPLFLPDDDEDLCRRSVTPAPAAQRSRPPVPLFHETADDAEENEDEDNGGMLVFSQVLHTMADHYTGAGDDDDEMEGMVLFGDADENRGL